jgi:trigger factor
MNITVERLPNCMASVRVEMPGDARRAEREKILRSYVQHAALPGFRKGKVPRSVVEKRFAADIDRELTDRLLNEGLNAAVKQENLRILSVTDYTTAEDNDESKYAFSLKLVLAPEVPLPEYKGLSITVPKREVTDEMVEATLEHQREQMANLLPADRPAQMGDFVTIDYAGTLTGQPMKELLPEPQAYIAENSGYVVKLDEESFLPGFCAQLEGMSPGEERTVTVTMPEEGVDEAVAGKEVVYAVTLTDVKEAELPELNDELAGRVVPGKTLEEVRGIIRENLSAQLEQKSLEEQRVAAMVALREKMDFDLPENFLFNATKRRVNQLVQMNLERGITEDILVENEQDIINAASEQAKVDVKDEFILMEVARKEGMTVTQTDLAVRISQIAYNTESTPDKVFKTLKKNNSLDNLRHSILLGKALDVLVQNAEVTYAEIDESAQSD